MKLQCPNCGERIPARNINIQNMTAVCEACDSVFPFDTTPAPPAKNKLITEPDGITAATTDDGLSLDITWRQIMGSLERMISFGGTGFAIVMTLIMVGYLVQGVVLTALLAGLVALLAGYIGIIHLINRSIISVNADSLEVRARPLPWTRLRIALETLEEVIVEPIPNMENYARLRIHTSDGAKHTIDTYQTRYAQYIKQELDHQLFTAEATEEEFFIDDRLLEGATISDDGEIVLGDAADYLRVDGHE